jgi:hypothetical protein
MNTNTALLDGVGVRVVTVPTADIFPLTVTTTNPVSNPVSPSQTGASDGASTAQTPSSKTSSSPSSVATRNGASQIVLGGILGVAALTFLFHPFTLV